MQNPMKLQVTQSEFEKGTKRLLILDQINGHTSSRVEIFFEMNGSKTLPEPSTLDGFLFGILAFAMRLGQDVHILGNITRTGLRNAYEFQDAWSAWKPQVYKKVSISADRIVEPMPDKDEAITAFSGGIDSLFTALRHSKKLLGEASYPLKGKALLVHGFDVPLSEPAQFEALQKRTAPLREELGFELITIRTNLREINLQEWEDTFAAQLACCMHNYAHDCSYALIGSSEPYNHLIIPWGSSPVTDHLLSSSNFKIVHDGAGFSRTEKVELVAKYPNAAAVAKVCWEGKETYKNCGHCEKCVRTLINFKAVGVDTPTCFENRLHTSMIRGMDIRNDAQCMELRSIVTYANKHGIKGDWLNTVIARIKSYDRTRGQNKYLKKLDKLVRLARAGDFRKIHQKFSSHINSH